MRGEREASSVIGNAGFLGQRAGRAQSQRRAVAARASCTAARVLWPPVESIHLVVFLFMAAATLAGRSAVLQLTQALRQCSALRGITVRSPTSQALAAHDSAQICRPRQAGMTRCTGGRRCDASAAPAADVAAVEALLARFPERPKCIVFDLVSRMGAPPPCPAVPGGLPFGSSQPLPPPPISTTRITPFGPSGARCSAAGTRPGSTPTCRRSCRAWVLLASTWQWLPGPPPPTWPTHS